MDKNIIKNYLTKRFLSEEATPGISQTEKVKKASGKSNKEGVKAVAKDSLDYNKGLKQDKETSKMAPNKFNYDDKFEKTYHDEMEILNGQEMIQYDSKPDSRFTKRAEEAIVGSSNMGNNPEWANVVEKQQGFEGPDFGKNLVKRIKDSTKKRSEQTPTLNLRGHDIQADLKDTGHKPYAIEETKKTIPLSDKNKMIIGNWVSKMGPKETAIKLINSLSQTGMVSDLPDSMEYGTAINTITNHLSKGNIELAFNSAKTSSAKLERKAMKDMMGENEKTVKYSDTGEEVPADTKLFLGKPKDEKKSVETTDNNKDNNNPQIKESMKRLRFKKEFNGIGNALKLIPESYKVDKKEFEMTDGNESYKIRWEGGLTEGKAIVITAADKKLVNEDINRMKALFNYKSQDTLGLVKGKARINENDVFTDIWNKSKQLLGEGEEIEGAKAEEGNWEDKTKKAPEATKHIQGKTSTDKGTQAPKAKEGDASKAVKSAPEATKNIVKGSTSQGTGTKAKEGHWEDVGGGEKMFDGVAPAPKEGHWEEASVSQASEAKKHVQGSASTEKGTQAPKPKEGNWEEAGVTQAAEAKKHVHLKETKTLPSASDDKSTAADVKSGTPNIKGGNDETALREDEDLMEEFGDEEELSTQVAPMGGEESDDEGGEEPADDSNWSKPEDDGSSDEKEPTVKDLGKGVPDDEFSKPKTKATTAKLLFSPSSGEHWIENNGSRFKVPDQYMHIAADTTKKGGEKAAIIIAKMEAETPDVDDLDATDGF